MRLDRECGVNSCLMKIGSLYHSCCWVRTPPSLPSGPSHLVADLVILHLGGTDGFISEWHVIGSGTISPSGEVGPL